MAVDYSLEDIEYVRSERKFWAARDQDTTLHKLDRKEAQKWIKACTFVLEYMTGYKGGKMEVDKKGKPPVPATVTSFPLELEDRIRWLFAQTIGDRSAYGVLYESFL